MESIDFLKVNNQSISLSQAIGYLKASGKFGLFLAEILRQHILEHELKEVEAIDIDVAELEQAIVNFRIEKQLLDGQIFQNWLAKNGIGYGEFRQGVTNDLKLEKLKAKIGEPKLEEYFKAQKPFFDRVVISRIIVSDRELANKLKEEILTEKKTFETLAKEYSFTDDRIFNGMMGAVSRGTLPDILKERVDFAQAGEIIGPIEIEGRYGLFRVEQFLDASLEDGKLKQELQNQLFEQWLQEKLQSMEIKLEVK
ncbi:MAG: peptidylprolyl isomerase [Microcoleus sp. PH2017_10_PVI_O_A]|uniref:peptidylprolyl isomerase n=1 Tax=unclassified Microcoleus TaxID=2642155 RepID=UPI001E185328|nr:MULTISPECIES: peptidylprolyl isomerase [unclassified Microcoleus]TAE85366.1 MAG: peptidylprolyl isomerase [Oscillatoriales cyanobacterium]MCC3404780.1 peptidylprolyl isomerase [Microcoleus sp. PH2017_10_PVI_O_A]MCC3458849.1 peptidylprolyl isomerase [Microcoleus sp. PH2017_11_PCY_U_A]MCC3477046.1 peptidylprolyl isomerase [Microcoleus sp. PH2017_12_PCY_D_A]MCC3558246.1 peptidylprolyl isomerase [Microcoleus sp. PH2017_27_LUM_O_A]